MALFQRTPVPNMTSPSPSPSSSPAPAPEPTPSTSNSTTLTTPRRRNQKQLSLFLAGTTFFALSSLITRRSLAKRHRLTTPKFYHPSNSPPTTNVNGGMEAFEALNIATVNVTSFAMMMAGGLLWAFDISSLEDMRRKVRGGMGVDGSGMSESEAEEEMEEWLATVLARKEEKVRRREEKGDEGEGRFNERGRPR